VLGNLGVLGYPLKGELGVAAFEDAAFGRAENGFLDLLVGASRTPARCGVVVHEREPFLGGVVV
jgi:hypothetical protein